MYLGSHCVLTSRALLPGNAERVANWSRRCSASEYSLPYSPLLHRCITRRAGGWRIIGPEVQLTPLANRNTPARPGRVYKSAGLPSPSTLTPQLFPFLMCRSRNLGASVSLPSLSRSYSFRQKILYRRILRSSLVSQSKA